MPKITFRADADLVERVEALDASKSEVMREALRAYLDGDGGDAEELPSIDALVDERVERRVSALLDGADAEGVTVNVAVNGSPAGGTRSTGRARSMAFDAGDATEGPGDAETVSDTRDDAPERDGRRCPGCGGVVADEHVFCPNCGQRADERPVCECGAELGSDWAFCPECGRRTISGHVLDG